MVGTATASMATSLPSRKIVPHMTSNRAQGRLLVRAAGMVDTDGSSPVESHGHVRFIGNGRCPSLKLREYSHVVRARTSNHPSRSLHHRHGRDRTEQQS